MMKKLIIVLMIVLILALTVVGGMLVYAEVLRTENQGSHKIVKGYTYDPGDFITNVRNSKRYLKTCLVIEDAVRSEVRFMEDNNHKIRDIIMDILTQLTEEDLKDVKLRDKLKDEIEKKLSDELDLKGITDIYFSEFVVQN